MGIRKISYPASKLAQLSWKIVLALSHRVNQSHFQHFASKYIYVKEILAHMHQEVYTEMFMVTLYTISETWGNPKCLWAREWMNKL